MQNKYTDQYFETVFTYHPPNDEQKVCYQNIREAAKVFAKVVYENTPQSADQSAALRKIREAVMTANASVALNGMC